MDRAHRHFLDLDEYVYRALRNGACGFLLKGGSPALLAEAVRAVAADNPLISPLATVRLLRHMKALANICSSPLPGVAEQAGALQGGAARNRPPYHLKVKVL